MPPDRTQLIAFLREERYAVQASVSAAGTPQAAVVGIVVSERFEVFFDTLTTTRKLENLRQNPSIALVIGRVADGAERTVQLEGMADEPGGGDLERLLALYFERFPDGRERQRWPGITYVRVTPSWLRYSDFAADPPLIVEMSAADLRRI